MRLMVLMALTLLLGACTSTQNRGAENSYDSPSGKRANGPRNAIERGSDRF